MDIQNRLSEPISSTASSAPNIPKAELNTIEDQPLLRRNKSEIFRPSNAFQTTKQDESEEKDVDKSLPNKQLLELESRSKSYHTKLFFVALISQLFGCTIAILLYLFILFPLTKHSTAVKLQLSSPSAVPPSILDKPRQPCRLNFTLKPISLQVKSYIEYQSKMYAVSDEQPVSVSIQLNAVEDWPNQAQLARVQQVTTLEFQGNFKLDMLAFMLSNVINLVNLTVINNGGRLCSGEKGFTSEKIILPKLRSLVVINFTTCSNVYGVFANNVEMKGVRQLKVENGKVDSDNVNLVFSLIGNLRNSLRKLCFPDTKWETVLLNNRFPILPSLVTFRMDYLSSNSSMPMIYINTKISKVFPKLTNFYAIQGFASWNDFRNILNSSSLQVLRSGIKIPEDKDDFKVYFLKNSFPSLEEIHLSLFFNISNGKTKNCVIDGLDSLKNNFKRFEIETNCDIEVKHKLSYNSRRANRLRFLV